MSYIGNEPVTYVDLDKLTDVVITSPTTDQVLKYNGTNWVNGTSSGGKVLQVVHVTKTDTFSGTSVSDNGGYFIDVTGMSASITPSSTANKILIMTTIYGNNIYGYNFSYRLKRTIGGTTTFPILGTSEGSRPVGTGRGSIYDPTYGVYNINSTGGIHQDSPNTTSAITYQVQIGGYSGDTTVYLNRSHQFQAATNDYDIIPVSTITLMEIAG